MKQFFSAKKIILLSTICILSLALTASEDAYYYKVNRSLELFGAFFQEISANYVDEVDPDAAIEAALDGMSSILDPYTELLKLDDQEDLDIMATGSYNGFGITIGQRDRFIEIMNTFDDFPAQRAGLRIGDKIVSIDGVRLIDSSADVLRKYTMGRSGSVATIRILRENVKDTLDFTVNRADIKVNDVSYSAALDDKIAYIRVESFTKNTSEEVVKALSDIKRQITPAGLVIDLRGNGGGLLETAISLCEIFVPKGSKLLAVKGRVKEMERTYYSQVDPIEPTIPLVVLIDSSSASASEIFAGAIQDLDRGVVVGLNSFGKGLVQSVLALPNNRAIKLTTAKYYTPSGRCIQKVDFEKRRNANQKNTILDLLASHSEKGAAFFTKNGRIVYETNGIQPDSIVEPNEYSDFVENLIGGGNIYDFANRFTGPLKELPKDFKVDTKIFDSFSNYLIEKKVSTDNSLLTKLTSLEGDFKNKNASAKAKKLLQDLKNQIKKENKSELENNKKEIEKLLNYEIKLRFISSKKLQQDYLNDDRTLNVARQILKNNVYLHLLSHS